MALYHGSLTAADEAFLRRLDTRLTRFFLQVHRVARAYDQARWGTSGSTHSDALTMAIALDPTLVTEAHQRYVEIETAGELTRGMTVVDHHAVLQRPPNVHVVYAVDGTRFKEMLFAVLGGDGAVV